VCIIDRQKTKAAGTIRHLTKQGPIALGASNTLASASGLELCDSVPP
jgi:hypothetical protein